MNELRKLPGVDVLLNLPEIKILSPYYNKELITYCIRGVINEHRKSIKNGGEAPDIAILRDQIISELRDISEGNLKKVINCTGIIIHTNLGRVPFSKETTSKAISLLEGYSNLEFDTINASRSDRNIHAADLLKYLTNAEDVLIVNNNAAAVILILNTFANNEEVIISRGELIEIGGSFRMTEVMKTSGCKMVEVGATNKTRISDYEKAITNSTSMLLKAHQSNYSINGFTEEVDLSALVKLGKKHNLPVFYDMGSGLLYRKEKTSLANEQDVKQAMATGADLVSFSGDKLLGGPQAGIIVGKAELIASLKRNPMMRALRVCKLTLAFLETSLINYLDKDNLMKNNFLFEVLSRNDKDLKSMAELLLKKLAKEGIGATISKCKGQYGGGSMPGQTINSYSLIINKSDQYKKDKASYAENLFKHLLKLSVPILGVLKKGELHIDVLALTHEDIPYLSKAISIANRKILCK